MTTLEGAIASNDIEGIVARLTEGMVNPYTGQALLGLSEVLLRNLTARRIVFSDALVAAIRKYLGDDTWAVPLLDISLATAGEGARSAAAASIDRLVQRLGVAARA
jgi:hypothetical protein